jgi:hypothetical protein
MMHPTSHIDTLVLAIAALLALLILLIGYHLLPEVADLMPPSLSRAADSRPQA